METGPLAGYPPARCARDSVRRPRKIVDFPFGRGDLGPSFAGDGMAHERTANAVDKRIGQRVRARRLEIAMSQERLAELLGVTFQQVQKYEKGANRIASSRLLDIAEALDMNVALFFEGLSTASAAGRRNYAEELLATPEGAELLKVFVAIKSMKVRRRAIELLRALNHDRI
jgi:transcriptional regulator with XRE-family HTH domain